MVVNIVHIFLNDFVSGIYDRQYKQTYALMRHKTTTKYMQPNNINTYTYIYMYIYIPQSWYWYFVCHMALKLHDCVILLKRILQKKNELKKAERNTATQ